MLYVYVYELMNNIVLVIVSFFTFRNSLLAPARIPDRFPNLWTPDSCDLSPLDGIHLMDRI